MMTRSLRSFFYFLLSGLLLGISASHVLGSSNFVRVPLGKGASIEVPKNWIVLSGNQRITIDTFVEAKGYRLTESTLNFAANLYDDRGKTIALVNALFYPENPFTQAEAKQVAPADLKELDVEMRKAAEASLNAMNVRMLNWYGSNMRVVNGLHVLVQELVDRRNARRLCEHVIEFEVGLAVHRIEGWGDHWSVATAMAGPARHDLSSAEVVAVDGLDHQHHATCRALSRRIECPVDLVGTGRGMTADAVGPDRCRHDAHRQ